ncbi:MAG TPA: hypothetical protein VGH80_12445 [Xanthomonadaceae bacterium]
MSTPAGFLLPIHVISALLAITAGMVALWVAKGSALHRTSGNVFSIAMLTMTASAVVMAMFFFPNRTNVVAGILTFYLVATGLLTVVRTVETSRNLLRACMLMAFATSAFAYGFGATILAGNAMRWMGVPVLVFGTVGLLAAIGDARVLRAGGIAGAQRLKRHLWRMGMAMWIATASLFLGQARHFPEPLRHAGGLRAIPVLWVLAVMFYWLFRLRNRRNDAIPASHARNAAPS